MIHPKLRAGGFRVVLLVGLSLGIALAAQGQPPRPDASDDVPQDLLPSVKGFERTDLWESLSPQALYGAHRKELTAPNAKAAPITNEKSDTSLRQFKWQSKQARSKAEHIRAAFEFLQREGFTIDKNRDH